ncbi:MAG: response regulator transcription factor [Arcobacteraceae bacterium]|nr:response regulator transcription factor [Arcobacteraceae bacterium]
MNLIKQSNFLYVEDDEIIAKNMSKLLSHFCNSIVVCNDGIKGLDIYKNDKIDVVILDIELPTLSGLEVAQKIRDMNHFVPIIVTTSHLDISYLKAATKIGLVEYLEKPVSLEVVIEVLQKCELILEKHNLLMPKLGDKLFLDIKMQNIIANDRVISLTKKEYRLLEILYKNKNQLVSKDIVFDYLWEESLEVNENALKNILFRLRQKLPIKGIVRSVSSTGLLLCIK